MAWRRLLRACALVPLVTGLILVGAGPASANEAPWAFDDLIFTEKNTPGAVNVLDNDFDPDGDPLSVTDWTNGDFGTVACTSDGLCTYTPDAAFVGSDLFTYEVSDGQGGVATGFVWVYVSEPPPPSAIIDNGTVQLGVLGQGHLNVCCGNPSLGGTSIVGLRYLPTGAEATAPGCLCEGWGVADATSGVSGFANVSVDGVNNLEIESFTSTASSAVSIVLVGSTFRVTHDYRPSASSNLYEVRVTIENISSATAHVLYRRVMDWDVEPTAFFEFVTIQTGDAEDLAFTSNNGFASANPLSGPSDLGFTGDFVDAGPADHGALFDFDFGDLAPGAARTFKTFYGAAGMEADADAALAAVGAEAYSYGQPNTPGGPTEGTPNTFIFAFGGVGGSPIFCAENGLDALAGTPAEGVASGKVHDTVEPAVGEISPEFEGTVHEVNCSVVVPLEDAVDAALAP